MATRWVYGKSYTRLQTRTFAEELDRQARTFRPHHRTAILEQDGWEEKPLVPRLSHLPTSHVRCLARKRRFRAGAAFSGSWNPSGPSKRSNLLFRRRRRRSTGPGQEFAGVRGTFWT